MKKTRVCVLGSNSFSGSDFIDLLLEDKKYEVLGISRSPEKSKIFLRYKRHRAPTFTFHQGDLNQDSKKIARLLQEFKPDYIVNFSAQSEVGPSWQTPWDWFETNTVALARLIDYLKGAKYLKKYVHISSPEIYGSCQGVVKETAPLNPSTPYAVSKAAADYFLSAYWKNFRFPVCWVRATNVYGAHQQLFKIIPRSVIRIKSGEKILLDGGGQAVKSYIHIRDVSRGELAIMEKGKLGEVYHLSPDQGYRVRDIVKKICQKMAVDFNKVTQVAPERLGQDKAYVIDSTKARRQLRWRPLVDLDAGIDEVIDWANANWEEIQQEPLEYIHRR